MAKDKKYKIQFTLIDKHYAFLQEKENIREAVEDIIEMFMHLSKVNDCLKRSGEEIK